MFSWIYRWYRWLRNSDQIEALQAENRELRELSAAWKNEATDPGWGTLVKLNGE